MIGGNEYMVNPLKKETSTAPSTVGMPGYQKTEKMIEGRRGGFNQLGDIWKRIQTDPLSVQGHEIPSAMMQIPFERGVASIANPLMAVQEGRPQDIGKQIMAGISGKKLGQLGDPFRRVGVPEPLAAGAGLVLEGGLGAGAYKTASKTSGGLKALGRGRQLKQTQVEAKLTKGLKTSLERGTDKASADFKKMLNKYGDAYVNESRLQNAVNKLPNDLMEEVASNSIFEKFANGRLKPTLKNTQNIRNLLSGSKKGIKFDYKTLDKGRQGAMRGHYDELGEIAKEVNPNVGLAYEKYGKYKKIEKTLAPVVETKGYGKSKTAPKIYEKGADSPRQKAVENLVDYDPYAKIVKDELIDYAKKQDFWKGVKRAVPWIAGGGGGALGINYIGRQIRKSSGGARDSEDLTL